MKPELLQSVIDCFNYIIDHEREDFYESEENPEEHIYFSAVQGLAGLQPSWASYAEKLKELAFNWKRDNNVLCH